MKNIEFWNSIHEELINERNVMLLIVAKTEGNTPGKAGFKLCVFQTGHLSGTIGGGLIENKMIKEALKLLSEKNIKTQIVNYSLNTNTSDTSEGMICGGIQTIIFYPLLPGNIDFIDKIISTYYSHNEGIINISSDGKFVIHSKSKGSKTDQIISFTSSNYWTYSEVIGTEPKIHIIGGGHVSMALSHILSTLNYHIIIYDSRQNLDSMKGNHYADEKITIAFNQVHNLIEDSERSCIIIMTPGHISDECVLRNTIKKNVLYIGMMASLKKRDEILEHLKQEGINDELLKKLHSPIGLPIKSYTPEEIAISIAAELIQTINSSMDHFL